jgi:hypothetical protein
VLALATPAAADAKVDWAKGLVIAEGIGIADRHAPNPSVALGTSRRPAEDAARAQLRARVMTLALASGGKVLDHAKDAAVKERLERAIEEAFALAAEPGTDGSWNVTMAVPIEAVRQAITGPRKLPEHGDEGPAVVVIDSVAAAPAVGWTVDGLQAATLWVTDVPDYAKTAARVHGRAGASNISVSGMKGSTSTLFVIVRAR